MKQETIIERKSCSKLILTLNQSKSSSHHYSIISIPYYLTDFNNFGTIAGHLVFLIFYWVAIGNQQ